MKFTVSIYVLALCFLFGCKKKPNEYNLLPNVNVNETLYLSQPKFFSLGVVNGWVYINGGSKGIIVFRKSLDQYVAYERHSPYQSDMDCAIASVDSLNLVAIEDCGKSEYSLINGNVLSGPASVPLKMYGTQLSGDVLQVFN